MDRSELEGILRTHLKGDHEELESLFRGVEARLDAHLARTEAAIADALQKEAHVTDARLAEIERRLDALESDR